MQHLGKILFPTLPRDLRRRRMNVFFITLFTSVMFASGMAILMIKVGRLGGH
jgi:hypothetical protein